MSVFPSLSMKAVEAGGKRAASKAAHFVTPPSPRAPRTPSRGMISPKADYSTMFFSPSATPRSMSMSLDPAQSIHEVAQSPMASNNFFSFEKDELDVAPPKKTYLDHLEELRNQNAFPKVRASRPSRARSVRSFFSEASLESSPPPPSRSVSPVRQAGIGGIVQNNKTAGGRKAGTGATTPTTQKRRSTTATVPDLFGADRMTYLDHLEEMRGAELRPSPGQGYKDILNKMRAMNV